MTAAVLLLAALALQDPPVFEAASEAMLLDVFVTREGEPVSGLLARDFGVLEGGRPCEVELVSAAEVPLAALLVFDTSASVAGDKLQHLRRASDAFLSGLQPHDQALLLTFSHEIRQRAPLTADRDLLRRALDGVAAEGRTSVHDALFSSLLLAPRLPGRPVVLLFSDGEDTSSFVGMASVLRAARESDVLVYAVGAGATALCGLTAVTGGRCLADAGPGLQAAFERVLVELRSRYLLRVTPADGKPGWHPIQVQVWRSGVQVRARSGYWRPLGDGR